MIEPARATKSLRCCVEISVTLSADLARDCLRLRCRGWVSGRVRVGFDRRFMAKPAAVTVEWALETLCNRAVRPANSWRSVIPPTDQALAAGA